MCRHFNAFLKPVPLRELLFERREEGFDPLPLEALRERLANRTARIVAVAEDCSKKSTKAGYDAAGMAVSCLDLRPLLAAWQRRRPTRALDEAEVERLLGELPDPNRSLRVAVARDGGDLLKTWDGLVARLELRPEDFITSWMTHVRQASQGDMYTEVNAHPHREHLRAPRLRLHGAAQADTVRELAGTDSLFYLSHNGDIHEAVRYKRFLEEEGFVFLSNSDSCLVPALRRFVYEHLQAGLLVGALARLAQAGFLREDRWGSAERKIEELDALARRLEREGALPVTVAGALVARVLEHAHPENKFAFQCYSPLGEPPAGCLGGGTITMTRGGDRRGGEEGGELIFHLPRPYDRANDVFACLAASEENALKEQVVLLDPEALAAGRWRPATARTLPIDFLKGTRAQARLTEGLLPLYDVRPGEIVQVGPDGGVAVFDLYSGARLRLAAMEEALEGAGDDVRRERPAPLKVFRADYFDEAGRSVPCPYNKYGEEILVVQPLALRLNTEKLFARGPDGAVRLRPESLGLTMGTSDEAERRRRVRQLTHVITGGAGTSFLINTVAANMARKLGLHGLPILNVDGFTGADTVPVYAGAETLFLANSNSGGTSDTLKLTHELAGRPGVLRRARQELERRPPGPGTRALREQLEHAERLEEAGVPFADWPPQVRAFVERRTPWVYVVTNIEASALGNIGRGLDPAVRSAAGAGITNLPEEECVGSTFAALASLQWQLALYTHLGELRDEISPAYAQEIYQELARLPEVVAATVGDEALLGEIHAMAEELVGGNFDFVFTGFVDGVPEEQAHKAAEMIQEMFAGWHFFQFQHGKYAHMKRRTRFALGSVLGHNAPPPSWPFFHARARKSPFEIGPRVATSFVIAHRGDLEDFRQIPDYAPDYVLPYPADSVVLYPFQAILIGQLISYLWGLAKKKLSERIERWNAPFVEALTALEPGAKRLPAELRARVATHARCVLEEFSTLCRTTPHFDRLEGRRREAILEALSLLAGRTELAGCYVTGGFFGEPPQRISLTLTRGAAPLSDEAFLAVLQDLAVELSTGAQAKRLADHFLVDGQGRTRPLVLEVERPRGRVRRVAAYDYLIEYEGLGTFYDVEPVHPPKIAKAKKGWL